ncbi:hypothetical protein DSO57_1015940 [Entomophthora muscae]|uniref:Uncharacterized protein n=1 Tax=Entomophthora muscae TaxID=34485 RepID=A0ACC2SHP3_9FUNG|nr:hypothetical protein DSO57_1015940 [Entomophthora muscae]
MILPNSWRVYKEGQDIPTGFVIYNNVLVPNEQYNTLKAHRLLPTVPTTTAPQQSEIPNIVFQRLCTAKIGAFVGLRQENALLWINSTERKFEQVEYPCQLWFSEISLCVTGTASLFVSRWLAQHPSQKRAWELFKSTFLKKFSMKDSNVVIMTELQTFKMTGTIEEYIAAYKDLCDCTPSTVNFDESGPHLDFYNSLPMHIRRQFDMTCCKNLEEVFLVGKHVAQKSDNLHATNKRKESPSVRDPVLGGWPAVSGGNLGRGFCRQGPPQERS